MRALSDEYNYRKKRAETLISKLNADYAGDISPEGTDALNLVGKPPGKHAVWAWWGVDQIRTMMEQYENAIDGLLSDEERGDPTSQTGDGTLPEGAHRAGQLIYEHGLGNTALVREALETLDYMENEIEQGLSKLSDPARYEKERHQYRHQRRKRERLEETLQEHGIPVE